MGQRKQLKLLILFYFILFSQITKTILQVVIDFLFMLLLS